MQKVVIDTNVYISSFYGGKPREVIAQWYTGQYRLCLSAPVVDEYVSVIQRYSLHTQEEVAELLQVFAQSSSVLFTTKTPNLSIVEKDRSDDKFIECGVALQADFIISGDKHLLDIKEYSGIQILNPAEFLTLSESLPI